MAYLSFNLDTTGASVWEDNSQANSGCLLSKVGLGSRILVGTLG